MEAEVIWLCLFLLLVTWSATMRDRVTWAAVLIGLLLAFFCPNLWLALFIAVFSVGIWRTPEPSHQLPFTVYPALLWAVPFVLLAPMVTAAWVVPVLATMVFCGLLLSAWAVVSLLINERDWDRLIVWNGRVLLHLYEHKASQRPSIAAGQGNANHVQAIAGLATAAAVGLIQLVSPWMLVAMVLCLIPICLWWRESRPPVQGLLYVCALIVAVMTIEASGVVLLIAATLAAIIAVILGDHPAWSHRLGLWAFALKAWWGLSWKGKLIGAGPDSWLALLFAHRPFGKSIGGSAHNEFLQALVEQGALGLLAMVGYAVTTLWALSHGSREAQAVFLVGLVLLTCALISFPMTGYSEILLNEPKGVTRRGTGSPALNAMSLAILTLGEVR